MRVMDQACDDSLRERYRELSDDIAAAVAVVSATRGSALHAITVDSFLDVSYDPPTMAVSVYSGSRMMETLETSSHFAISLLNSDQRDISERLGASGQPLYGSLKGIDTFPAPQAGQPVLADAIAWFELELTEVHPGVTVEQVQKATGWDLAVAEDVQQTQAPTAEAVRLLRDEIDTVRLYLR